MNHSRRRARAFGCQANSFAPAPFGLVPMRRGESHGSALRHVRPLLRSAPLCCALRLLPAESARRARFGFRRSATKVAIFAGLASRYVARMGEPQAERAAFGERVAALGAASLASLDALEFSARHLELDWIGVLREKLAPLRERLALAEGAFASEPAPPGLEALAERLLAGAQHALAALGGLLGADGAGGPGPILAALRRHAQAQATLYTLRGALPPLARFFCEEPLRANVAALDPEPPAGVRVGVLHAGEGASDSARGGFSLYVPERYDGTRPLPLVVALHGALGHGSEFLWTWLREARSRQFLLLAASSRGTTWSLDDPARDAAALAAQLEFVAARWRVDRTRVLLTGLSDGASFALLAGLAEGSPYTALAPVAGVLHPANAALGNLARARGRRIYLVHGARDWLFPVALARAAQAALAHAGADLAYREIADLAHCYPREENDAILRWLDPALVPR